MKKTKAYAQHLGCFYAPFTKANLSLLPQRPFSVWCFAKSQMLSSAFLYDVLLCWPNICLALSFILDELMSVRWFLIQILPLFTKPWSIKTVTISVYNAVLALFLQLKRTWKGRKICKKCKSFATWGRLRHSLQGVNSCPFQIFLKVYNSFIWASNFKIVQHFLEKLFYWCAKYLKQCLEMRKKILREWMKGICFQLFF